MTYQWKDHVVVTPQGLQQLLGMEGDFVRTWTDPDTGFVHIQSESTHEFRNALAVAVGGYCEERYIHTVSDETGTYLVGGRGANEAHPLQGQLAF